MRTTLKFLSLAILARTGHATLSPIVKSNTISVTLTP